MRARKRMSSMTCACDCAHLLGWNRKGGQDSSLQTTTNECSVMPASTSADMRCASNRGL